VLAALPIHHGHFVTAETLADAVWEQPPESVLKVVQGRLVRLRNGPPYQYITSSHPQSWDMAIY
jgi:hypothetical protein